VSEPRAGLRVDAVSVSFEGLRALDGVTLGVDPGQVVGVIGPNGAGKTTLFNVICGFVAPDSGTIGWRGESLAGVRPHKLVRLGIARTVQGVRLFPRMTALENVMIGGGHLHRAGLGFALLALPRADRAAELLDSVGLSGKGSLVVRTLSHGEQRQLEIALALAGVPRILLLDEPTAGLSPSESQRLVALLKRLESSLTLLVIEHDMDVVFEIAERITVLHDGNVIADGRRDEVRANPLVNQIYFGTA